MKTSRKSSPLALQCPACGSMLRINPGAVSSGLTCPKCRERYAVKRRRLIPMAGRRNNGGR